MRFSQQFLVILSVLWRRALFLVIGALAAIPPILAWLWLILVFGDQDASSVARVGAIAIVALMTWPVFLAGTGATERRLVNRLLDFSVPEPGDPRGIGATVRGSLFFAGHLAVGGMLVAALAVALPLGAVLPPLELAGFSGAAAPVIVAVAVLPSVIVAAGAGVMLPRLAVLLLGPSRAELAALALAQADLLRRQDALAQVLHDSVGHALALASAQTSLATGLLESDPDAARAALGRVQSSLSAAHADLDYSFGVLRGPAMAIGGVLTMPQRPLTDLDELILESRSAGLDIRVHSEGDFERIPAALSTAAFRIVQDSLTRAIRHASPLQASLRCELSESTLEIDVFNPAEGMPRDGDGIDGIRERVEFLGGRCVIGATGDGWLVRVILPTHHAFA